MQPLAPGTWPSPLSAADVACAGISFGEVAVTDGGRTIWWSESRPAEKGRTTILRRTGDGPVEEMLPLGLDARTRVHEYGGACWLVLGDGFVTSDLHDQRLWRVEGGVATPLTPETEQRDRFGDPVLLPGGTHLACVREQVADTVTHSLVSVPLDGSGVVTVLWDASDFVCTPRLSPDGCSLAFLTWDHPQMPWDGSQVRVGSLAGNVLSRVRLVLGDARTAMQQPVWRPDGSLVAVGEVDGWWNLVDSDGAPLWRVDEECGWSMWQLGTSSVAVVSGNRLAVVHGQAQRNLSLLGADGVVTPLNLPFTSWRPVLAASGKTVVGVAAGPDSKERVIAVDVASGRWHEVAGPEQPDPSWTAIPEMIMVPSVDGRVTHAVLYPPTSPLAELPAGVAGPYVLAVHGGPTGHTPVRYDAEIAYFTSRGIGVVEVNYGGSTGYGRPYRDALRGNWGVVDVEDCEAVARWLLDEGKASQVAIRGGSAGGWTVLAALTRGGSVFGAGASYYGVVDLVPFASTTHDFESRYLDGLIGPLPEALDLYVERSPLTHVDRLDRPLLVLQGLDDPVVPPEQAELLIAALKQKGVRYAYLPFAGESHGFRDAANVAASLEAELSFYGQVFGFVPPGVSVLPLS